ncbi:MAG: DUF805 domain-containing protein [Planctomycetia bacterium]|nr:DUF805 domain-containing protein [Planctomycetia bacterium]
MSWLWDWWDWEVLAEHREAYLEILQRFGDYESAADQGEFFLFHGYSLALLATTGSFLWFLTDSTPVFSIFTAVFCLLLLPAEIALCVRRLHDLSTSPWFVIFLMVPGVNLLFLLLLLCIPGKS